MIDPLNYHQIREIIFESFFISKFHLSKDIEILEPLKYWPTETWRPSTNFHDLRGAGSQIAVRRGMQTGKLGAGTIAC